MTDTNDKIFEFDGIRVEPAKFKVWRGGEELVLEPKTLSVLIYLLENRGRLIEKEELLNAIWQDTFVTENAMAREIAKLRKALGDDAKEAKYVQTVHTKGYRFVAEVNETIPVMTGTGVAGDIQKGTESVVRSQAMSHFTTLFAGAKRHKPAFVLILAGVFASGGWVFYSLWPSNGIVAKAQTRSIVALPCQVFSGDEGKYLEDAVPNTLTTMLGQLNGLEVKAPPTSLEFEQIHGDVAKLVDTYKVNTIVACSVNVESSRLNLNVQLIEPSTHRVIWSKDFQGQTQSYIDLVKQATEGIRETIAADAPPVGSPPGLASSSDAELAFLQGKYYSDRFNNDHRPADFDIAFSAFKRALETDPKLAGAAGEIAMLHVFKIEAGSKANEMIPKIYAWAQKGLEIDQRCSRALIALVAIEVYSPNTNRRKVINLTFKAAVADPNDSMIPIGVAHAAYISTQSLVLASARESERLNPLYMYAYLNAAVSLRALGRSEEGLAEIEKALELEPDMPIATYAKLLTLAEMGRSDEAASLLPTVQRMVEQDRLPPSWYQNVRFAVAASKNDGAVADAALSEILKVVNDPKTSASDVVGLVTDLMPLLVSSGKSDAVWQILDRAAEGGVAPAYDCLLLNVKLRPLRSDPRFKEVAKRSRAQLEEMLQTLTEARSRGELPGYLEKPLDDLKTQFNDGTLSL